MKIGNHTGKRATFKNKEGYVFETISWFDWYLFVFDSKIGHDAISYFRQHQKVGAMKSKNVVGLHH